MKVLRAVSRLFLKTVEAYERFKDSQILSITKEKLAYLGKFEPNFLLDGNLKQLIWRGI